METSIRLVIAAIVLSAATALGQVEGVVVDSNTRNVLNSGLVNYATGQLEVNGVPVTSGGAGAVSSVFGRTGAVLALANDYTFTQIGGKPTTLAGYGITDPVVLTSGSYADPAWITALAYAKITGAPNNLSFINSLRRNVGAGGVATDTIDLVGDVSSPGASQYYGTNSLSARGFYSFPVAPVASVFGRTGAVVAVAGDYASFYVSLSGSYSNPSWITALAWSKITGAPAFEPALGNPSVNGYLLSSTTAGVRSWIAPGAPAGQALTNTNDTNVTLTLGGSPSTALLAATSLTLGWTGTLAQARGGLGVNAASVAANTVFGNNTGASAAPGFVTWSASNLTNGVTGSGAVVLQTTPTISGATINRPVSIQGTNTNNAAGPGIVGETVTSALPSASQVTYTTGQTKNLTSISLTAGDWDVRGNINFFLNALPANTFYAYTAGIGTTTGVITDDGFQGSGSELAPSATTLTAINSVALPAHRISLAATTTVYLVAKVPAFTGGAVACYGYIEARRMW